MYFKFTNRKNPKTQQLCAYFRLVESYRDINNRICHRTIVNVGFLEGVEREQLQAIQQILTQRSAGKAFLNLATDEVVSGIAETLWAKIVSEKRIDIRGPKVLKKKPKVIDISVVEDKQVRELGKEWLCYQCLKQLDLRICLKGLGWDEEQIQLTFTQIICRASYPASELRRSKIIQQISAVCEITGYPVNKISKDKLYKNAQALYKEKNSLEAYLSKKAEELFNINDENILYNITSIYFEDGGTKTDDSENQETEKNTKDKLHLFAMVLNSDGFLKYSNIFKGSITDANTIPTLAENLKPLTGTAEQRILLVIDASIATEQNLRLLETSGYDYVCVSRSKLKNYQAVENTNPIEVLNRNNERLALQQVIGEKSMDYYLKGKGLSEDANLSGVRNQFEARFVEELQKINQSILKKNGVKALDKIKQRVAKLLEKYPTASRCFTIKIVDDGSYKNKEITWQKKEKFRLSKKELGVYFIRTNLTITDEGLLWKSYNMIREVEASFRTITTNLDLYPVYHKDDEFTLAHLHVDLLAHWAINTIRFQLKGKQLQHSWQEILDIASSQKLTITNTQNKFGQTVITKRSSDPTKELSKIIDALEYKHYPFATRKSVLKNDKPKKSSGSETDELPLEQQINPTEIRIDDAEIQ